jgi:hypothetical protein
MVDFVFFTIAVVNSATAFAVFSVAFFPLRGEEGLRKAGLPE